VAADCPPKVAGIKECERGALIALDRSGRIRSRVAPSAGKFHPGDVSASPGVVMVSDSQNGAVYRLAKDKLAVVVAPGVGKSGQGSAIAADGKRLVVADYSQGISSIDLATGSRSLLPRKDGKPLRGIDGLVRCGATHFGIYNGQAPGTLVSFTLNDRGLNYDQPLGETTLPDPTHFAFDGKRLLIVADSGWAILDKPDFVRKGGAPVIAIPLGKDCKPL
jgi:DNA-binding beta-propeller fold protein YncE